nr:eukaryotic translation initiation factor 3 subunit A-like [Ipomoea batatas]GMD41193.1 eukaryotic translation initiation factor 3 subunit A-like [Ipomoea batatas]
MLETLRLLQQVSQVYQTIQIDILSKMISFFDFVVEKISVEAVKHNLIAMKADHIKGAVFFGKQNIESEGLRNHLSTLAKTLS